MMLIMTVRALLRKLQRLERSWGLPGAVTGPASVSYTHLDVYKRQGDDQIVTDSLAITESLCSDEDLSFGSCEAAQFEITGTGLTQSISGREFMAIESFGGYNMVLGLFKVESTPKQEDKNTRKIIAYDRMQRFDVDVSGWYNALSFPIDVYKRQQIYITDQSDRKLSWVPPKAWKNQKEGKQAESITFGLNLSLIHI